MSPDVSPNLVPSRFLPSTILAAAGEGREDVIRTVR